MNRTTATLLAFSVIIGILGGIAILLLLPAPEAPVQPAIFYKNISIDERGNRSDSPPAPRPADTVKPITPLPNDSLAIASADSISFSWEYLGKTYNLTIGVADKLYQDYQQEKRLEVLLPGETKESVSWQERYNAKALVVKPGDNLIIVLADGLKNLAKQNRLNDDGLVELDAAFIQALAYKDGGKAPYKFPYLTLCDKEGDCDDRSLLSYQLLSQQGYGVCLYQMPDHMAMGIASDDPSGYSYFETTDHSPVSVVPDWVKDLASTKIMLLPKSGKKYQRKIS